MTALSSVLLPAPLAPMMVTISLSRDLERHAAYRLDLAVGDMHVRDLQQRAHAAAPR